MAVLPTPIIRTRGEILSMWPKWTEPSHSMPMWMRSRAPSSQRPGISSSFPFGAPLPTKIASKLLLTLSSSLRLETGVLYRTSAPMSMM